MGSYQDTPETTFPTNPHLSSTGVKEQSKACENDGGGASMKDQSNHVEFADLFASNGTQFDLESILDPLNDNPYDNLTNDGDTELFFTLDTNFSNPQREGAESNDNQSGLLATPPIGKILFFRDY